MKILRALPLLFLLACGGDDDGGGGDPPDAQRRPDAERPPDAEPPCETGAGCLLECDLGTPTLGNQTAYVPRGADRSPDDLVGLSLLNDAEPFDLMILDLWSGYGALADGLAPGTYQITGDELDFQTCGVCLYFVADCNAEFDCQQAYFATGGTVTITSTAPNLAFTISNLTAQQADIDTLELIEDGCTSEIELALFDAVIDTGRRPAPATAAAGRRSVAKPELLQLTAR
jgi:hypothetical protein